MQIIPSISTIPTQTLSCSDVSHTEISRSTMTSSEYAPFASNTLPVGVNYLSTNRRSQPPSVIFTDPIVRYAIRKILALPTASKNGITILTMVKGTSFYQFKHLIHTEHNINPVLFASICDTAAQTVQKTYSVIITNDVLTSSLGASNPSQDSKNQTSLSRYSEDNLKLTAPSFLEAFALMVMTRYTTKIFSQNYTACSESPSRLNGYGNYIIGYNTWEPYVTSMFAYRPYVTTVYGFRPNFKQGVAAAFRFDHDDIDQPSIVPSIDLISAVTSTSTSLPQSNTSVTSQKESSSLQAPFANNILPEGVTYLSTDKRSQSQPPSVIFNDPHLRFAIRKMFTLPTASQNGITILTMVKGTSFENFKKIVRKEHHFHDNLLDLLSITIAQTTVIKTYTVIITNDVLTSSLGTNNPSQESQNQKSLSQHSEPNLTLTPPNFIEAVALMALTRSTTQIFSKNYSACSESPLQPGFGNYIFGYMFALPYITTLYGDRSVFKQGVAAAFRFDHDAIEVTDIKKNE